MRIIHSIEPLSQSLIEKIKVKTSYDVQILNRESILSGYNDIVVLICRDRDNISGIIDCCPNLKFIFIVSTGVEKLPFQKLIDHNILVCNTGGVNANIMSEYVMGYILAFSVRTFENFINQKKHYWKKFQCVESLNGKTVLIVGAGRTGQLIAQKAKIFGMRVIGIKKHISNLTNFDRIDVLDNIDDYLPYSDYIVCTIPVTKETKYLFNYEKFNKMQPTSIFINISRGLIINQEDLVKCLNENKIGGAILDVFESEPLPQEDSLWEIPNCFITPHSSGRLTNFMDEAINIFIDNINAYSKGLDLPNKVNLHEGY